jgi:hypothetical protein
LLELTRNLKSNDATDAQAAQKVGALRLNRPDLVREIRGHLGRPGVHDWSVLSGAGLKAIDGMSLIKALGEVEVEHRFTLAVVHQEKRRFVPTFAD